MATKAQMQELFGGHHFKLKMHLHLSDGGRLVHECEALGLTRYVDTPKVNGRWGENVATYTLKGDETVYKDLSEVADALLARKASA